MKTWLVSALISSFAIPASAGCMEYLRHTLVPLFTMGKPWMEDDVPLRHQYLARRSSSDKELIEAWIRREFDRYRYNNSGPGRDAYFFLVPDEHLWIMRILNWRDLTNQELREYVELKAAYDMAVGLRPRQPEDDYEHFEFVRAATARPFTKQEAFDWNALFYDMQLPPEFIQGLND